MSLAAGMALVSGVVAAHLQLGGIAEFRAVGDHILGQVHQDRARPSRPRQMEGLLDGHGQVFDVLHQIVVFGAGAGDSGNVRFLEGVVADEHGGNLAGEDHQGDGIHVSGGQAGYGVRPPRAGGDQADPHFPRGSSVPVSGMNRALLMPHQDMADFLGIFAKGMIQSQDGSPGQPEDGVHAFLFERFEENLRSRFFQP